MWFNTDGQYLLPDVVQLCWAIFAPEVPIELAEASSYLHHSQFPPVDRASFLSLPQMLLLNNSLYAKLCLSICFWTMQPATQSKAPSLLVNCVC